MWPSIVGMWILVLTIVHPSRPPQVHQVRQFATQEACLTFQQQIEQSYSQAERSAGNALRAQGHRPLPRPQRLYDCEERTAP